MKRIGYIYEQICSIENLTAAAQEAARGKKNSQYGVRYFQKNAEKNIEALHNRLIEGTFRTSPYRTMTIKADRGKIREIYKLPFFPDRILHHAIMRVINPCLVNSLIYDTYACIKGRGLSMAVDRVKKALKDIEGTKYCLKIDIRKFYPSINHDVLMKDLERKIKDKKALALIEEIVRSTDGLPIGSYTSQLLANFAVSRLDHFIKEELKVKYYFRYCDDMVFLGESKERMWEIFRAVKRMINEDFKLQIKGNYAVFPIGEEHNGGRTIDFLGYRFTHERTLLRKDIKQNFARRMAEVTNKERRYSLLCSYKGWCQRGNCINLWKKITGMKSFKELNVKAKNIGKDGRRFFDVAVVSLMDILNQDVKVLDYESGVVTKNGSDRYAVLIEYNGKECKFITNNYKMKDILDQCREGNMFPFSATIKRRTGNNNKADYYFE